MILVVFRNHRYDTYSQIQSEKSHRNKNNNQQTSSTVLDVAECMEEDIELVAGSQLLLAKGTVLLDDAHTSRVISFVQACFMLTMISFYVRPVEFDEHLRTYPVFSNTGRR
jgi:hypothetical protein